MKRFLLTLMLLAFGGASASPAPAADLGLPRLPRATATDSAAVYVCMSQTSYAYHRSQDCAGLGRCSHPIKALRLGEAEKLGKRSRKKCW